MIYSVPSIHYDVKRLSLLEHAIGVLSRTMYGDAFPVLNGDSLLTRKIPSFS